MLKAPLNHVENIGYKFQRNRGDMVNCSNCDCSTRNCSTLLAANQLLDTKNEIARIGLTGFLSSFIFCVQTNNCSTVICSTLLAGKQQLLDTIYSKENGVHVRQLGQVDMYGSQVRCQVRLGQVRLGQVRLGQDRLGQVRLGQVRLYH